MVAPEDQSAERLCLMASVVSWTSIEPAPMAVLKDRAADLTVLALTLHQRSGSITSRLIPVRLSEAVRRSPPLPATCLHLRVGALLPCSATKTSSPSQARLRFLPEAPSPHSRSPPAIYRQVRSLRSSMRMTQPKPQLLLR